MSANLMWEPAKRKATSLPYSLRKVLQEFRGVDGQHRRFAQEELTYLCGLRDAGVEGADEIIQAIEQHGEVELWLEY